MKEKRDFLRETRELLRKYPELLGGCLPREVVDAAMEGMSLVEAYEQYIRRNLRRKAPVTGTTGHGTVEQEDDFLRGFNS